MNRDLSTYQEGEDHVKISHFTKKGYEIIGVVHVGTNEWYEYEFYKKMGIENVIGFEPLQEPVQKFLQQHPEMRGRLYNIALGMENDHKEMNVASGDGQSSTFFELTDEYKKEFPDIEFVRKDTVRMMPFHQWRFLHPDVNLMKFNCLVVDVEGMELAVLQGMGKYLLEFPFLNIELSGKPTYQGAPGADQVVRFLQLAGYKQDSPIEDHNDVMFIKESAIREEEKK